jgi:hypothetical protein
MVPPANFRLQANGSDFLGSRDVMDKFHCVRPPSYSFDGPLTVANGGISDTPG